MEVNALKGDGNFTIGVNASYLLQVLDSMKSEHVTLAFIDENQAALIKGGDDIDKASTGVIMPMRL